MSVTIQRVRKDISLHFFVRAIEWVSAFVFIFMGRALSVYGAGSGPLGAALELLAPVWLWAIAMEGIGTARILALIANGTFAKSKKASPLTRSAMAFLSMLGWLFFGGALFYAFPKGSAAYAFMGLAVLEGIMFPTIMQEAGTAYSSSKDGRNGGVG